MVVFNKSVPLPDAGKLALVYGGFAGLVATLVFLYMSAATLIFGAEINGVLRTDGPKSISQGDVEPATDVDRPGHGRVVPLPRRDEKE